MNVKIGWGRQELSLEGPVMIPGQGYVRISEGIKDPLWATALVIDGGGPGNAVIFCSMDLLGFYDGLTAEILETLQKLRPDIPADALILNATHTHSSINYSRDADEIKGVPVINGKKAVRPHLISRCLEAVAQAWDSRAEGGIGYGYGYAVVAHSRRVIYSVDVTTRNPSPMNTSDNGYGVMYGNTNDPDFSHYESGADHFLNAMFTFDPAGKLTGVVANVPCPSQCSEHISQLSADFWHDVRVAMAQEFGEDVYILPQAGAAGDLAPRILHYKEAQARRMRLKYGLGYDPYGKMSDPNKVAAERKDIAERIVSGIREIYSWAKKDIRSDLPIRCSKKPLTMARRVVTDAEYAMAKEKLARLEAMKPQLTEEDEAKFQSAVSKYSSMVRRYEKGEEATTPGCLHAVQVGDVAFATTQYELYQDYMHRLQARSPFLQTFVVQMCGYDGAGYLPTTRGLASKGYSTTLSDTKANDIGGQQWVEAALETLSQLKNQK